MLISKLAGGLGFLAAALFPSTARSAGDASPDGPIAEIDARPLFDGGAGPFYKLDVLFVIDDTSSMGVSQRSLAANFPRFVDELRRLEGGLPDVHIGVISTDVGAGGFDNAVCEGDGENGRLRAIPHASWCDGPTGNYIIDRPLEGGGRERNYPASLEETFSCIADIGTDGCGFAQPLEALRRALDGRNVENEGFLRDGAFLAVVVITDGSECSAADPAVFDPSQDAIEDPLGPFGVFRCAEFGIACGDPPMPIGRTPASYSSCEPRIGSYFADPQLYAEFVGGLKPHPGMIVVSIIAGQREPVEVRGHRLTGEPELTPSCVSSFGQPLPTPRLHSFADYFGERSIRSSLCDEDLSDALRLTGISIATAIREHQPSPTEDEHSTPTGCGCTAVGRSRARSFVSTGLLIVMLFAQRRRRP